MVDALTFVEKPEDTVCSFCKTTKLGRVVICNTPSDDCYICADCIDELSSHINEIREAMAHKGRGRN